MNRGTRGGGLSAHLLVVALDVLRRPSGGSLAVLHGQRSLSGANLQCQRRELQLCLVGEPLAARISRGLAGQLHGFHVLADVVALGVLRAVALHVSREDAQVAQLHGLSLQHVVLDGLRHVANHARQLADAERGVVAVHVLGQSNLVDGLGVVHAAVHPAVLRAALVVVSVKIKFQHSVFLVFKWFNKGWVVPASGSVHSAFSVLPVRSYKVSKCAVAAQLYLHILTFLGGEIVTTHSC